MLAVNIFYRALGLISTVILARLLPPEDFGLVAMATVLIEFFLVITEFGFDSALIQKQNANRTHYDTAWTFNVIFGIASAAVLVALAWPASSFYEEPRVTSLVILLALGVVLRGFQNIGIVDFRKNLEFHREFILLAVAKVVAFVVTITIAVATQSYWALVIGTLSHRLANLILSYVMHPFRPRFSIARRKELFSFSVWLWCSNVLLFLRTRGADLIVGRLLGPRSLGLLTVGNEVASLPTTELIAPINRAVFPGYSRIAGDKGRMRAAFENVFGVIATVALPAAAGISVIADLAIPILLGDQWGGAVPIVQILAIVGLFTSLHSNTGVAYIALGKPYIHVILQSISACVLFPLAYIFAKNIGIIGVAYAYLIANGSMFAVNVLLASRLLDIRLHRLGALVVRPLVAAMAMYFVVWLVKERFAEALPIVVLFIVSVAVGAAVFAVALLGQWMLVRKPDSAEVFLLEHVRRVPVVGRVAGLLLAGRMN